MPLKKGDYLIVLAFDRLCYVVQNKNGSSGWVPHNCVEIVNDCPSNEFGSMPNVVSYADAFKDYRSNEPGDLEISTNERLSVLEKRDMKYKCINKYGNSRWIGSDYILIKYIRPPNLSKPDLYGIATGVYIPKLWGDLPLNKGEYLIVLQDHNRRWMVQKQNGASGYVPRDCVKIIDTPSSEIFKSMQKVIGYAMPKLNYEPNETNELKLIEGETLSVLEIQGLNWKVINRNGTTGWVTCIDLITLWLNTNSFQPNGKTRPNLFGMTRNQYEPRSNEHVSLNYGDKLIVLEESDDGSEWLVQKMNGSVGFVPAYYVLVCEWSLLFENFCGVISYARVNCTATSNMFQKLQLFEGEYLSVLKKEKFGKWKCINRNGDSRWIDSKYVTELDIIPLRLRLSEIESDAGKS